MKQEQFDILLSQTVESINNLLKVKGGEYASDQDRLSNFRRGAALCGITPLQVAFIYASKHYDAIATYIRDDASGTERQRSEGIEGRLDDLINYAILIKALVVDSGGG